MGSISFGLALVTGKKRVPKPATGNTAFVIFLRILSPWLSDFASLDVIAMPCMGFSITGRNINVLINRNRKNLWVGQYASCGFGERSVLQVHILRATTGVTPLHMMNTIKQVTSILAEVLGLGERAATLTAGTRLLGNLPEFDSMAVIHLITALEEHCGIVFEDDDLTAQTFDSVGSLCALVDSKRAQCHPCIGRHGRFSSPRRAGVATASSMNLRAPAPARYCTCILLATK